VRLVGFTEEVMGFEVMDWFRVAQYREQWNAAGTAALNTLLSFGALFCCVAEGQLCVLPEVA